MRQEKDLSLREGINKIENAKAIWDKFMDMFEDI